MVSVLDVMPTVLTAAGTKAPDGRALDGVAPTPSLAGTRTDPPHALLFWRYGTLSAVRDGRYKLLRVRDEPLQLYDLETDPGESHDLAPARPELVERLRGRRE